MPRVLVLNSGSSSVKYQLLDLPAGEGTVTRVARGTVERVQDHDAAVAEVLDDLAAPLAEGEPLVAVGHRVVHGGDRFTAATVGRRSTGPVPTDDRVETTR